MEYRALTSQIRMTSQRTMCGTLVPYGHDQRVDDYLTERFERGAFNHQLRSPNRVRLYNEHSVTPGAQHIGHGVLLRDEQGGLYGEFRVADSEIGRHYLAMAREGMLRQWSIGFVPDKTRQDGAVTVYTRASLFELALVEQGAYGDLAAVAAVREAVPQLARDTLLARLPKARFPQ